MRVLILLMEKKVEWSYLGKKDVVRRKGIDVWGL